MQAMLDTLTGLLSVRDLVALAFYLLAISIIGYLVEHAPERGPSTSVLMSHYRREWMRQSPLRENRMIDSALLVSQRNGAAFFASGSMLAIGGLIALLGQADRLLGVAQDIVIDIEATRRVWELKLVFLTVMMVAAFLKFVWANRVFGYCAVLLGAVPEEGGKEEIDRAVERAARLNITAGRSFNKGLRGVYFTLAGLAWFVGPEALIVATLFTAGVIYRREFLSDTRRALL